MIKDTETLYSEIKGAGDIDAYLEENKEHLTGSSFAEYICGLLKKKGLSIAEVQRKSQLTNYIYEIFKGVKTPTRNIVLQLCFGFSLTPEESQRLLRLAKTGSLYPRDRRDSVILFGLKEKLACAQINDLLDEKGLECIL